MQQRSIYMQTTFYQLFSVRLLAAIFLLVVGSGLQAQMQFSVPPTNLKAGAKGSDAPNVDARAFDAKAFDPKPIADTRTDEAASRAPVVTKPESPSQFQLFVQQSTGRVLPIFGRDLFDSPQAYAADNALPAPADYLLGVGDEVRIQVWGSVDFLSSLVIDRNGQVNVPKVGVLPLAGVAVRDLESTLRNHLGRVFTNFQVNATLGRLRGIQVYVVGQARQPGTFQLSSLSTLVNALFASGGPNANGSMRAIELKRAGQTISTIDLYDFIARGDKSRDLALMSGDVIVIPPVGPRVAVTGALDQAAIYELKSGSTSVADILALSGGVPTLATVSKALLERIDPLSQPPRQVREIPMNAQGQRESLRDGDVLTLLGISSAFSNAVTLQGLVARPLRYGWFEGMKIADLIPDREALVTDDYYKRKNLLVQSLDQPKDRLDQPKVAGAQIDSRMRNMVDQINWDYAVIERLDRNKLTTELIPFNLGKVVLQKDPVHNLALQAGDVVTVLSQKDLRVPQDRQSRLVRVEGEVAVPGVYQAAPGETLPQLLRRIGGLTPQAYVFGTEFNRESVRARQQENLDNLTRKLETQLQSQAAISSANRGADTQAQTQALQQMQLRAQVDRLKSVKSNGRMALELDTQSQTLANLPALPLEDGDRIHIPAMPGFVAAFGSVNNENVFVYKHGRTLGDIIKSAGLTEDSEPDQAFVLRADGSIIARRDRGGLFGGGFETIQVMPGDTLVVPAQIDRESRYTMVTRTFKDWTQILSNFGLGVAAINSISKL
jgi:protein involved in polysaccharide export with SLBB domain